MLSVLRLARQRFPALAQPGDLHSCCRIAPVERSANFTTLWRSWSRAQASGAVFPGEYLPAFGPAALCGSGSGRGCAVGPKYKRPPVQPPDKYYLETAPQPSSIADLGWWELFKDPV